MLKILLTGSSGFIGSNILKELSQNHQVFILIRKKLTLRQFYHKNIIFIKFSNYEQLNKKLKKLNLDVVIHCATHYVKDHEYTDIKKLINSNIFLGNIILENLNSMKVKKFINFSTVWQDPYNKKDSFQNLYAAYKSGFNKIVKFYNNKSSNIDFFEIILSDTFGFGDKRNKLINTLKNNYIANKTTKIISKNLYINLLNVEDIVVGLTTIIKKRIKPGQYVLKNSKDFRVFDLIRNFNRLNTNKIKVSWISQRIIKNKIKKYDKLKNWTPKKSRLLDIVNYIKDK
jgi:nucleoside-diphosphate-sugar epimerase